MCNRHARTPRELIARNRFGLGARVGDPRLSDRKGWLIDQLNGVPPSLIRPAPTDQEVTAAYNAYMSAIRRKDQTDLESAATGARRLMVREVLNLLNTQVTSKRPFAERWIAFWTNHLCVSSSTETRLSTLIGAYERQAIRPNVFGAYEDLLLASARHPAMLLYLDNTESVGPNSAAMRRGARRRHTDLNENYARELLELHTVGVHGGYDQEDIRQLAAILTGWNLKGVAGMADGPLSFRFSENLHEPGSKIVLGVKYQESGESEGVNVIRDLARRPATAEFIATRLVRHFVSDDPPPAAVANIRTVWLDTSGDLRSVAIAIVELEEAWSPEHRKFRTPQDWVVAVLRAMNVRQVDQSVPQMIRNLRQQVWAPSAPTGYKDGLSDWSDPDSLMNRAEAARALATELQSDGTPNPRDLVQILALNEDDPMCEIMADESIENSERLALCFASPAFQWR